MMKGGKEGVMAPRRTGLGRTEVLREGSIGGVPQITEGGVMEKDTSAEATGEGVGGAGSGTIALPGLLRSPESPHLSSKH